MMDLKKLLVGSLLFGLLSGAQAQTISPAPNSSAHIRFRSFYKDRDIGKLPDLLQDLERSAGGDWMAHPPIMGFIAGLLAENPGRVDLLPQNASNLLKMDLAFAYSLSGQSNRALTIAKAMGLNEESRAFIRSTPSLQNLTVRNPTELDYLWGAAFATGNPAYVRPIVKRFMQLVDQPQKANDVIITTEFMQTEKGDIHAITERYNRREVLELALASAILAALSRNAAEHEFIRDVVTQDLPRDTHAYRAFSTFSGRNF